MNRLSITAIVLTPLLSTVGCAARHGDNPHHRNMAGVADAERSVLTSPGDTAAWCDLGEAYSSARQFEKAHAAFTGVITRGVDSECGERGIESLNDMGWLTALERSVLESPDNDELWGDLGDHYSSAGDTDAALSAYMYAMLLDPRDGEWHGKISTITGESVEDLLASANALTLISWEAQLSENQEDDEWLGDYGDMLMSVGREEEACELYATALALDPDDGEWLNNVAECNGEPSPDSGEGHMEEEEARGESVMDYSTEPTYGEVSLESGFEPDPHQMEVIAGGDARVQIAGCFGYVLTTAPDARLQYTVVEGAEFPLYISVTSIEDTVLFVNTPADEWICNDDIDGINLNPAITMESPMEGQYDIWVGTYNQDSNATADLMFSENNRNSVGPNLEK